MGSINTINISCLNNKDGKIGKGSLNSCLRIEYPLKYYDININMYINFYFFNIESWFKRVSSKIKVSLKGTNIDKI